jgi:hypothetical protein
VLISNGVVNEQKKTCFFFGWFAWFVVIGLVFVIIDLMFVVIDLYFVMIDLYVALSFLCDKFCVVIQFKTFGL